jgi:hypothetical protein
MPPHAPSARSESAGRSLWAFRAAVVVGGLGLVYLCLAITLANAVAASAPRTALLLWPWHAVANARQASAAVLRDEGKGVSDPAVATASITALRRDPSITDAARNLGLRATARGESAAADRLMGYAEATSRRDVLTQLWMIERKVARSDVKGALTHYATVLRVAPAMGSTLYPVLTGALTDPDLSRSIAEMVSAEDNWRDGFMTYVVGNAEDPRVTARFFTDAAHRGSRPAPALVQILVGKLLAARALDEAAGVYRLVDPRWRRADIAAQLDGGFDRAADTPPLGWTLNADYAAKARAPEGGTALSVRLNSGESPEVARRMLMLPGGRYRVRGAYAIESGQGSAQLRIGLECAPGSTEQGIATVALDPRGKAFDAVVDALDCGTPWLTLTARDVHDAPNLWLDNLVIERIAAR